MGQFHRLSINIPASITGILSIIITPSIPFHKANHIAADISTLCIDSCHTTRKLRHMCICKTDVLYKALEYP